MHQGEGGRFLSSGQRGRTQIRMNSPSNTKAQKDYIAEVVNRIERKSSQSIEELYGKGYSSISI